MLYNSYYFCFYHQNFLKKVCSLLLYGEELAAHIEKKRKLKAIKMHLKRTFHFSLNAFGCEGIDLPPDEFCLLNCVPNRESLNYQPFDIDEVSCPSYFAK